jgi:aconitase B
MGKGAQVYLASAELAAVCALLGRIPTVSEGLGEVIMLKYQHDRTNPNFLFF